MDTLRITYEVHKPKEVLPPRTKEDRVNMARHLIRLISDIHISVARILLSKGISIIRYHHTVKKTPPDCISRVSESTVHSFSQSLTHLLISYFLHLHSELGTQRQTRDSLCPHGAPMYVQSSLGKCLVVNEQVLLELSLGYWVILLELPR